MIKTFVRYCKNFLCYCVAKNADKSRVRSGGGMVFTVVFIFFIFFSCQNNKNNTPSVTHNYESEKIVVNREIVRREHEDIELIAKRYGWNLTRTESGLYYQIIKSTNGAYPKGRNRVKIEGNIMLVNGKEIYNSKTDGVKEFTVDQSDEPVGLHELVKRMRIGEKANAIIPSHLAYGTSGSGNDVPPAASLIYKIELTSIK